MNLEQFEDYKYLYDAELVSVYDGDSIRVNIDLGFGINHLGDNGKGVSLRLYGLDAPEIRGEEREKGIISENFLREYLGNNRILLQTIKDKTGKYGRYLAIVYVVLDGELVNVNQVLVDGGYAEERYYR